MKRIFVRALVTLVIAVSAGCGAASDESLMADAKTYQAQGEISAAIIQLKTLLQQSPDHLEARFMLGQLSLEVGDLVAAERHLQRVLDNGYDANRVLPLLVDTLLSKSAHDDVEKMTKKDPTLDPSTQEALAVARAEAFLATRNAAQTSVALEEIFAMNESSVGGKVIAAQLALIDGDTEAGESLLHEARDIDDQDPRVWLMLGRYEAAQKNLEGAADAFSKVVDLQQRRRMDVLIEGYIWLAETQLRLGEFDAVVTTAKQLRQVAPGNPYHAYLRAKIAHEQKEYDQAYDFAHAALKRSEGFRPAQELLGAIHYARGEYAQAESYLSASLAVNPANLRVRQMLAATRLKQDKAEDAANTLLGSLSDNSDNVDSLNMLGLAKIQSGEVREGLEYLNRALEQDPASEPIRIQLANTMIGLKDYDDAIGVLQDTPQGAESFRTKLTLAAAFLLSENRTKADELVEQVKSEDGGADVNAGIAEYYLLQSTVQASAGNFEDASQSIETALQHNEGDYRAHYMLARAWLLQGESAQAADSFRSAIELKPDFLGAIQPLAVLMAKEGDPDGAFDFIANAEGLSDSDRLILEGDLLSNMEDAKSASEKYRQAWVIGPRSRDLAVKSYVEGQKLNDAKAIDPLISWVGGNPEDEGMTILLGDAYLARGQNDEAISSYEQALTVNGDNAITLNNLAWAYHIQGNPQAEATARRAVALEPENGSILDTLGWILVAQEQYEEALDILQNAANLAPDDGEVQYHYAVVLRATGDAVAARELLTELTSDKAQFPSKLAAQKLLEQL